MGAVRDNKWWSKLRALAGAVVVLAAVVLAPASATAQNDETSHKLEAIRKRMESGLALFVSGKVIEAAKMFDEGYSQYPYSAFLFNSGVCYQKLNKVDVALEKFREYVKVDPSAPDIDKVQRRITALEALLTPAIPAPSGADGGVAPPPSPAPQLDSAEQDQMRSLVVVETEPPSAPISIYAPVGDSSAPFQLGQANPGWRKIIDATTPTSLSLGVGRYQVVVEKYQDFNASDTTIDVSPGHVHHFKANLSQGVFMAFLRVSANVRGAHIYLDDPQKKKPEWGTTPYGELVPAGEHRVLIEVPGFQPLLRNVQLVHGEQKEIEVNLARVGWGYIRIDADAPEIKVFLDGQGAGVWRSGETPLDIKADAGPHTVKVVADDRKDFEGVIVVPMGQVQPVHAKMIPKYPRGAAWTQAIIGAAFVGAGIYFGVESNTLRDQVRVDRDRGVLEPGDSRIAQGRWYAIGANAGFAVGGVMAILSTYNFIKDPLPESSRKLDEPVEFEDVLKRRPTARLTPAHSPSREAPSRSAERRRSAPRVWTAGPAITDEGAGFFVGGSF